MTTITEKTKKYADWGVKLVQKRLVRQERSQTHQFFHRSFPHFLLNQILIDDCKEMSTSLRGIPDQSSSVASFANDIAANIIVVLPFIFLLRIILMRTIDKRF